VDGRRLYCPWLPSNTCICTFPQKTTDVMLLMHLSVWFTKEDEAKWLNIVEQFATPEEL
jgi:hypothetical protein